MAKPKERSEIEFIKGQLREAKSIIRNLTKELARANKKQTREADLEEQLNEYHEAEDAKEVAGISINSEHKCPKCGSICEVSDLFVKLLLRCTGSGCKYRSTIKKE